MAVTVQQEQLEPCRVSLTIEVPPDDIQKAMQSVFNQFAKRTTVPGFRPGKAPRHLLQRFIDEGRVRELALDQALNNAYRDALRQANVNPYEHAEPEVELPQEDLDPEKGFSFKATIATQPVVSLGELDGLTARRVVTPIQDADVDRELDRIREQAASFQQIEDGAQDDDRVRATVLVTVDGEAVPDASFDEPTLIQVGANLATLDEGLRGMKAGEEKSFEFSFPDDFVDEGLRGKQATATVNVSEVWRRTVPEATDELATRAGFENLDGMRSRVREALEAQSSAMADQEVHDGLIREFVRRAQVDLPNEMIEHEVSQRVSDLIKALERRSLTLDDYLASQKTDLATLQAGMREEAVETLRTTLVLVELARQNSLLVTQKEIEEEIKARAEAEGVKVSQMRKLLSETGEINSVQNRIFYHKVAGYLRDRAEVTEVEA